MTTATYDGTGRRRRRSSTPQRNMTCETCAHFRRTGGSHGRCGIFALDGYVSGDWPKTHAKAKCVLHPFRRREGQHPNRIPFSFGELQSAALALHKQIRRHNRAAKRAAAIVASGDPDGGDNRLPDNTGSFSALNAETASGNRHPAAQNLVKVSGYP